jgi:hypothetical protein
MRNVSSFQFSVLSKDQLLLLKTEYRKLKTAPMEISLLLTLDLREQAALQAALVTHGAPDCLVTLALTGACRISTLDEARKLRRWLADARAAGQTDFISLNSIERALVRFGV